MNRLTRRNERTRSRKRVYKTLPGGGRGVHYRLRAGAVQRCRVCKRPLAGFSRASRFGARKLSRGRKSVSRPFGGQVCPDCLRHALRQASRNV